MNHQNNTIDFNTITRQWRSQRLVKDNCPKFRIEFCWIVYCYWTYSLTTTTTTISTTTVSITIIVQQSRPQWSSVFIQQPSNTRCLWHLYFMHTTIISKWIFFLCPTNLFSLTKLSSIIIFYNITPSQQSQTQTSNPNEDPIIRIPIIRIHHNILQQHPITKTTNTIIKPKWTSHH